MSTTYVMSPPDIESALPVCQSCGEYLENHWRNRECLNGAEPSATKKTERASQTALFDGARGWK